MFSGTSGPIWTWCHKEISDTFERLCSESDRFLLSFYIRSWVYLERGPTNTSTFSCGSLLLTRLSRPCQSQIYLEVEKVQYLPESETLCFHWFGSCRYKHASRCSGLVPSKTRWPVLFEFTILAILWALSPIRLMSTVCLDGFFVPY